MKYLDEFRNSDAAQALCKQIETLAAGVCTRASPVRIMEVCGTHTMAIARYGIRSLLPEGIELISGPGCPVCVTDTGYIDAAITLAQRGIVVASFGDMLRVPGTDSTLSACRSEGAQIVTCYSPLEVIDIAVRSPDREIVFLGVGFETTTCPVLGMLDQVIRASLANISILTAFKVVPPALELLAADPDLGLSAFLCPAHVSAIIGATAYRPVVERFHLPAVIAGFEPLDILYGIAGILQQIASGKIQVDNQYNRVVKEHGNKKAQELVRRYTDRASVAWRGLGVLPDSGLSLKSCFNHFDASRRHGITVEAGHVHPACRCGQVLKGTIKPPQCELFGKGCSPQHPVGPCMVSAEGSCAAFYKYVQRVAQ